MNILAIETSCDETAVAVLKNNNILSSVISSQIKLHKKYGGVYPEMAAREHLKNVMPCIKAALKKAKIEKEKIDVFSTTAGPGLIGSLLVGVNEAKALSYSFKKPIIGINHLEAHIYAARPKLFPAVCLIVSGGHTNIILMKNRGKYKILGETQDDAAGEALDKTGKLIGLSYPAGPEIEKLAMKGNSNSFNFPRAMIKSRDYNFSFSGLKTAALRSVKQIQQEKLYNVRHHIAASFQRAIFDVLIAKSVRAVLEYGAKSLVIVGGVASNNFLRQEFKKYLKKRKIKINLLIPPKNLCTDNAAMVGLTAYFKTLENKYDKWYNVRAEANKKLEDW